MPLSSFGGNAGGSERARIVAALGSGGLAVRRRLQVCRDQTTARGRAPRLLQPDADALGHQGGAEQDQHDADQFKVND
jgi:hypothetical protein